MNNTHKSHITHSHELRIAVQAAKLAGKILMKHYGKLQKIGYKKNQDIVTIADKQSEQAILSLIKKYFPTHSIFAEESGRQKKKSPYEWVIDPLDGTTNYTIQNPYFNVSIGLTFNYEPIVAAVYYPLADEMFTATRGGGAHCNGEKIHCSSQDNLAKAFVGFCYGSKTKSHIKKGIAQFSQIKPKIKHLRQLGSAALELAYVGAGRIDGFWMSYLNAYDVGAGALIAQEAGAMVTDFKGNPFTTKSTHILAANQKIHKKLLAMMKGFWQDNLN